jgi:hypothetical protein
MVPHLHSRTIGTFWMGATFERTALEGCRNFLATGTSPFWRVARPAAGAPDKKKQ